MGIDDLRSCVWWTDREARVVLSLWRRSGLSVTAFARRQKLSRTRLLYWRARIDADSVVLPVALAPGTVVQTRRSGAVANEGLSGPVVRVERDVDDAVLARVIAVAERAR